MCFEVCLTVTDIGIDNNASHGFLSESCNSFFKIYENNWKIQREFLFDLILDYVEKPRSDGKNGLQVVKVLKVANVSMRNGGNVVEMK